MTKRSQTQVLREEQRTPVAASDEKLLRLIQNHFRAEQDVRRGVCLLNAGAYDEAIEAFEAASRRACDARPLASLMAACLIGKKDPARAAEQLERTPPDCDSWRAARIRTALALSESGRAEEALASLRESIAKDAECADFHFQLGTLLAALARFEEAELRFTQAINIDRDHTEALVSLSLCCGVRGAPVESVAHLRRAQSRRPHDARIGLLLARALAALNHQGKSVHVRAEMPQAESDCDAPGIEELSNVISAEPDFVDAFLSIPSGEVDERVFAMLLETLETALERQPEHAELHYHCGRVLARLGRNEAAINENEQALKFAPKFVKALIELGKLYGQTDRASDATARLEQAIAAGAEYADVYFLLGNLYRDQGDLDQARRAYRRALRINDLYEEARTALESLPA